MAKKAAAAKQSAGKRTMSAEHKEALAQGRLQGRAIRAYLEALETHRPKRGRKRTPDGIVKRIEKIAEEFDAADPMKRVLLIQEQMNLQAELDGMNENIDVQALEADFIEHAWAYSEAKGITRGAWRAAGVPAAVLRSAGL